MAVGGSARTVLIGLGFAAGVVVLLLAPVGAGEGRRHSGTPVVGSAGTQHLAVAGYGSQPPPEAVQAYLSELDGDDPVGLLQRGQALCRYWRAVQPGATASVAVAHAVRGRQPPDHEAVVRAASRHLCPQVPPPR